MKVIRLYLCFQASKGLMFCKTPRLKHPEKCVLPLLPFDLTISNKLLKNLPLEYISHFLTFSARTSANQTQDLIDSKLDKRQAPGSFRGPHVPQPGSASCCVPSPPGWALGALAPFFYQEFS